MEREHILCTLDQKSHNMSAAAKALGISRASLYHKLKVYGHELYELRSAKRMR